MMASNCECLSVEELSRRCRQESESYLAGRPHDESYCLELFRRAVFQHDQVAWQAIYAQYQSLILYWVQRHSQLQNAGEEPTFFVNAAFVRFWYITSKKEMGPKLDSMGKLLHYLKCCVHSAIVDDCRRWQRWSQGKPDGDGVGEPMVDGIPRPEEQALRQVVTDHLVRVVRGRLQGEEEMVVAALSWMYDFRPREIQMRRPDLFPDARRVYQVKRNILKRLRRDPELRQLWKSMA
jgi:hypothetical protein